MATSTFKILMFLKRRPGMSLDEFRDYYENCHAPLCQKYMNTGVSRYLRRYVTAHPNPETGAASELAFDVITELWFDDEAVFRGTVKYLSTSLMPPEVIEDEKRLFDREKTRMATVEEHEST
jgi:uncharacterized protein (TIGR02118 family)